MHLAKPLHYSSVLYWGTTVVLSMGIAAITQTGHAQTSPGNSDLADTIVFHETFDPPGDDSPDRTSGVGSRHGGRCSLDEQRVRTLMPQRNFGLTFAERPTVVIQLPENTSARRLILTMTDEQGDYYGEQDFAIAGQTGIVSLLFSDHIPAMTVGRNYRWHVIVVCGEQADPDDPVLVGWVQRVEATLAQELEQKTPVEQIQWLAENGYWYDMVEILLKELRSHPNEPQLEAIWQSVVLSPSQG